ncbi:SRP40, C-terminal domain-containing protein [Schizophyllum commune]
MSDYGARAHQDLIVTRGAGFRKEKNKKKRGSYRGGEITVSLALALLFWGRWGIGRDANAIYRWSRTVSSSLKK